MPEEFRTGQISIPAPDADDVPGCCFTCASLSYKEFSVGEDLCYYFCGYLWQDKISPTGPPCLADPGTAEEKAG